MTSMSDGGNRGTVRRINIYNGLGTPVNDGNSAGNAQINYALIETNVTNDDETKVTNVKYCF